MFKKVTATLLLIALTSNLGFATAYDSESLKEEVSSHIANYEEHFEVEYDGKVDEAILKNLKPAIVDGIKAIPYLDENWYSYAYDVSYTGDHALFKIDMKYITNKKAETELNKYIEEQVKTMGLEGKSDFVRAMTIADWISDHYAYDDSLNIHDAPTMQKMGIGVCSSYALMFQKMAVAAGLDSRLIPGKLDNTPHLWNLVNINGKWYHVDITNYDINFRTYVVKYNVYDAANYRILLLVGSKELSPFVYTYDKQPVTIADYSSDIDVKYNNNQYDPAKIAEKLANIEAPYKASAYTADYDFNKSYSEVSKKLNGLTEQLGLNPKREDFEALQAYVKKADALKIDTKKFVELVDYYGPDSIERAEIFLDNTVAQITKLKGKQFTETTAIKALTLADQAKAKVNTINFMPAKDAYFTNKATLLGKEAAKFLLDYDYKQYQKTKKVEWLNKINAINNKYGVGIVVKK